MRPSFLWVTRQILWVSENYLFHAYARYKYFTNSESHNRNLTNEEKSAMASEVVLAALDIPSVESSLDLAKAAGGAGGRSLRQRESLMMEKAVDDSMASAEHFRNQHMANLLRFSANPSRAALIQELEAQGLLELATPAVRELYADLEEKFHPLELVGKVAGNLEVVAAVEVEEEEEEEELQCSVTSCKSIAWPGPPWYHHRLR